MSGASGCGEKPRKKEESKFSCPESKRRKECDEKNAKKDEFGRELCEDSSSEKEIECHESRKKFFEEKKNNNQESGCQQQKKKIKGGDDPKSKCASDGDHCSATSKEKSSQCAQRKKDQNFCCKTDATVKKSGTKQSSSSSEDSDGYLKMPEPQVMTVKPCLPRVERGICAKRRKQVGCVTSGNPCPQKKKVFEFFCIDIRNEKMNECIRQYTSKDASQVNAQCSQFSRKRMHTTAQSLTAAAGFLPPKYRQIVRRWLPAAGLYVFATAAITAWVSEWGPVVNHIPFYRDREEVAPPKLSEPESPEDPPSDNPSTSGTDS